MTVTLSDVVLIAVPLLSVAAWLFRLEGRINVTDARYDDIIRRLERIEYKQDKANGTHP